MSEYRTYVIKLDANTYELRAFNVHQAVVYATVLHLGDYPGTAPFVHEVFEGTMSDYLSSAVST